AGAALRDLRGAAVEGEDVRVAVHAHRVRVGGVEWIVPGARRELHDAWAHRVGHHYAGQTAPALVEHAHHVAAPDAARRRVGGMHADGLAAAHLRRLAERADVELAVQAGRRVVGGELEREAGREGGAPPLWRLQPGRMPWAVVVAESVDRRREDLEPAARRGERPSVRIRAEPLEEHQVVVDAAELEKPGFPELVERRRRYAFVHDSCTPLIVE